MNAIELAEESLGVELMPWQREYLEASLGGKQRLYLSGRRAGRMMVAHVGNLAKRIIDGETWNCGTCGEELSVAVQWCPYRIEHMLITAPLRVHRAVEDAIEPLVRDALKRIDHRSRRRPATLQEALRDLASDPGPQVTSFGAGQLFDKPLTFAIAA